MRCLDRGDYDTDPDEARINPDTAREMRGFITGHWRCVNGGKRLEMVAQCVVLWMVWPLFYVWMDRGEI